MTTRREYAISLGLAKPTRGRMSREAHAAIEKAESEGMNFTDSAPAKPKTVKADTGDSPKVKAPAETVSNYAPARYRYDEQTTFSGVDSKGKRHTVNGRQACTCGYSLMGHVCDSPSALIGSERIAVMPNA